MIKNRRKMHKKCHKFASQEIELSSNEINLGSGIKIDREKYTNVIQGTGNNGTKFARAMMITVFTKEELIGKSLFGKLSNAQPTVTCQEGLKLIIITL